MHKTNVSFALNNTRLFFRNQRNYYFNANQSCENCSLSDLVTIPNILFQVFYILLKILNFINLKKFVDILRRQSYLVRELVETIIRDKEKVFINVTVGELLFDGYEDQLIKNVCEYFDFVCKALKVPERIGLFYGVIFKLFYVLF
jgi:hypothetical protein